MVLSWSPLALDPQCFPLLKCLAVPSSGLSTFSVGTVLVSSGSSSLCTRAVLVRVTLYPCSASLEQKLRELFVA